MLLMRRATVTAALASALLVAGPAAADLTKEQCAEANEKAQSLRAQESLQAARSSLALCLDDSCPGPIRQDCAERVAEIDRVMPSVVFDVKDAAGHDVLGVTLRVDGKPTPHALEGGTVPMDPGKHELTFVPASGAPVTQEVVIREGEKARRITVEVAAAAPKAPVEAADPGRTRRIVGLTAGGVGLAGIVVGTALGFIAKSTYDSALSQDCGGNLSRCSATGVSQVNSAHGQATGATVGFVAGGVLLAGGVTLWLTARQSVVVAPTAGGATVGLAASF
jgi:hypothetical protein